MGYPNVAVYRKPTYFTPHLLAIQSALYYLSAILQDRGLSYWIYQAVGVENGLGAAGYPPGGLPYEQDTATSLYNPIRAIFPAYQPSLSYRIGI